MIFNVLSGASNSTSGNGNGWTSWVMLGIMAAAIIALLVFNRRSQKKRQEETQAMLNAIKPGNKVKTIGGICGVVVEVCPDDNTFVLETGTEASGKSFLKFDMQAVYQTDAVVEKTAPKTEEAPVAEAPVEAPAEKPAETVEEAPAEEKTEDKE